MCKGFLKRCLFIITFKRFFISGKKYVPTFKMPWFGLWHLWSGGASSTTLCGMTRYKPLQDSNAKVWPLKMNVCSKCNRELLRKTWK